MNYQIQKFYDDLISVINNSNLPVGIAFYVVKDCLLQLQDEYQKAIMIEQNSEDIIETSEVRPKEGQNSYAI